MEILERPLSLTEIENRRELREGLRSEDEARRDGRGGRTLRRRLRSQTKTKNAIKVRA